MTEDITGSKRATVLMVSTSYPADSGDWRGLFIRQMTLALARRNDIQLRLWSPPGETPANASYVATEDEAHWLASLMAAGGIAHLVRTGGMRGLAAPLRLLSMLRRLYQRETGTRLYHVNWLQNALTLPRNDTPLLVTVLGTDMQLLKLPGMTSLLRRAFRGRRVAICPNADWMHDDLVRRFGDIAEVEVVPFGIDPGWFEIDRSTRVEVPAKWLCVSRLTRGKLGTLLDWGAPYFSGRQRELHLFGPMQQEMALPDWVHYHGPATPASLCAEWFPQACGLISMSQHAEGRPQVMLEAMAAGLPIVASRIAAHEDLLDHRETGLLCGDLAELGDALALLDDPAANVQVGQRARAWAQERIGTWDDCAERYAVMYRRLGAMSP
ncbi:glycosyltransferase family 4 protein [Lysobacter sp. S4-A87]|uniref:glycosyltransferase family 4 protein n=1 Tax=Lysobacter sp. S4-A87 TaxID=2925843 RepID=UPI001F52D276|nr:glycosyltransferase family 4 protein [Lysobacter sp. S4-A87]UNK48979.1 glycosyltransferase family 4 protein [Lysobacter sp. S4-A87]